MPFARIKRLENLTQAGIESRIRRAAQKRGLRAIRSRWRLGTVDNLGGWQFINDRNTVVAGSRFDLGHVEALRWLESP